MVGISEETLQFSGNLEYPSLSKIEIIKFIKEQYGDKVGVIDFEIQNRLMFGICIQSGIETCILDEETHGGYESLDGIKTHDIFLYDSGRISLNKLKTHFIIQSLKQDFLIL